MDNAAVIRKSSRYLPSTSDNTRQCYRMTAARAHAMHYIVCVSGSSVESVWRKYGLPVPFGPVGPDNTWVALEHAGDNSRWGWTSLARQTSHVLEGRDITELMQKNLGQVLTFVCIEELTASAAAT